MASLRKADVQANPNVQNNDILSITLPMINHMIVEGKSEQTITSYVRAVERLVRFHGLIHPKDLDIDKVLDFLVSLSEVDQVHWRTNKMHVAGLRYDWNHMLEDQEFADRPPYLKGQPSLPKFLSSKRLTQIFAAFLMLILR